MKRPLARLQLCTGVISGRHLCGAGGPGGCLFQSLPAISDLASMGCSLSLQTLHFKLQTA